MLFLVKPTDQDDDDDDGKGDDSDDDYVYHFNLFEFFLQKIFLLCSRLVRLLVAAGDVLRGLECLNRRYCKLGKLMTRYGCVVDHWSKSCALTWGTSLGRKVPTSGSLELTL